jgi:hypothetical protein
VLNYLTLTYRHILAYAAQEPEPPKNNEGAHILGRILIAAVCPAGEEKWDNSPRVVSRISDSVHLAQLLYERVKREFPHYFLCKLRVKACVQKRKVCCDKTLTTRRR